MPHTKGTHLHGVRTLEDLRQRSVIDEDGCWHFRRAGGQPLRTDRPHVVWFHPARMAVSLTRLAWELAHGYRAPENLKVVRTCDSFDCCNPAHLMPKTHARHGYDLARSGALKTPSKQRAARETGEKNRKVTPEAIAEMARSSATAAELAARYGVHVATVNVWRGRIARTAKMASPFYTAPWRSNSQR